MNVEIDEILGFCTKNMRDLNVIRSWGETAVFYNPQMELKRGVYVATIKEADGKNDRASNLDRNGIYRLNIGVPKDEFISLFGNVPKRPAAGGVVEMDFDFTKTNVFLPHPVYAWMGWICILSPKKENEDAIHALLMKSYRKVKLKHQR